MISVQTQIEIQGDINLTNLSQQLEKLNLPKEILKTALTKLQNELIFDLCGKKYQHYQNNPYKRAGNTKRTLNTRHGTLTINIEKTRNTQTNTTIKPLLLYLGIAPKQRI